VTADPWSISAEDFPANGTMAEKWKFFLRYAVLAPSSHNSQPWLFRLRNDTLELRADRRRACRVKDPNDRELVMSCGCALFHLRCAMRHFGYLGTVEIFPDRDPDLVARVSLNARENVALVTEIPPHRLKPEEALQLVGLAERLDHFSSQMSGGEQQHVAIARSIAGLFNALLYIYGTESNQQLTSCVTRLAARTSKREGGD